MSNLINPEDLIRSAEPGTMVYATGAIDGERLVSLFIREDAVRIASLSNPLIELRAGVFAERHAVLVTVMAQINQEFYESWWNYHQPDGQEPFALAASQPILPIHFFSARARERSISVPNHLATFFQSALINITQRPAWPMADFDRDRELVYGRYPSVKKLWRALK